MSTGGGAGDRWERLKDGVGMSREEELLAEKGGSRGI